MDRAYEQLEAMRESARRMIASVIGQGRGITHQAREERDVIVRSSLQRLEQLDIGREALCFGRIDLERGAGEDSGNDLANGLQQGLGTGDTYYIGRLAVSGPDHEPLIVDWRAPVAEPFYRATGAHPMGLARRRHFLSEARTIVAMEDEVFGDADVGQATVGGILVASLERARTAQMRDIVATIQREQDEIIRAPLSGLLVVQGGPGTGKTAVALHRAAYLLYTHRFPLERQGVLVVGPNQVFLRYIEAVLPSLGESGAVLTTLGGLVPEARVRATEAPALAALKGQERMAAVLKAAVRGRERPLVRDLEVPFGRYVLRITTEQTGAIVRGARRRHGTHNARRRFVEADLFRALHQRYAELAESRRASTEAGAGLSAAGPSAGEAEEAAEASEGEASEQQPGGTEGLAEIVPLFAGEPGFGDELIEEPELRSQLRSHPAVANALDRMWPRLSAEELIHDLFGARPLLAL
ncbi:MAG TPA: hypothetical protein VGR90_01585, partial [Acidimicrobiales bacterium]|nr:hypothetical protein [Acidimicrobiales bacterium]